MYVKAIDGGLAQSPQTAELLMIIQRNERAPFFIDLPYDRTILYTRTISNDPIVDVNATDTDAFPVVTYSLIGDDDAKANFAINSVTGRITQIGDIIDSKVEVYNVSYT